MTYFFELGSNIALSVAEIAAVFGMKENYRLIGGKILLFEDALSFAEEKAIGKMGGVIKIGELFERKIKNINIKECLPFLEELILGKTEKICFGVSYYGRKKINIKHLGMDIKSLIKERDGNCRWVSGKENVLSSVIVEQNRLLTKGFELIIIETENGFYLGHTKAVQPFKELSARDYGRPARDDHSGMLPPKLAQIMINLVSADFGNKLEKKIYDPFCGSGTILTEAMLMGFANVFGSDLSERAVLDTKKNIGWIVRRFGDTKDIFKKEPEVRQLDVRRLGAFLEKKSIDMIATEPYLGPQRGLTDIYAVKKELECLYKEALGQFKQILKAKGRVVIIFPIFKQKQKMQFLNVDLTGFKLINPLPISLQNEKALNLSFRKTIIYGRESQRVWREIVVLEMN
ncbi:MAG: putative DNA methylase [Candidatus Falkowbacteria bacterium GW2011_GWC2_38_22]|uniref:Putative DNA methylase n=1 Tax=Candidatus Falkowbacteria bacterium GW2011_GWE1_38_31 TaxID=1618638 RepID=A0A0G0JRR7_9BACT|nr:MAG: putative DNA methylase [Candidatus Falkowbacteria bacterium GW2011_GWF2_38_1205]KKQ60992.1 MAG: putative DNA methylase [Candidatus Falkowbacteria bacterium GW2011_GWC2_38_22]KKQ63479.1 MAG: putative DNA methylase [Candidatus Falkowbacteria bacterium GW2011_GWF1_38_22]KKQ65450.1 MAG: putative DNA methylase [Candidatus Falkowbacteria bacterium GW2011_GWE2_38_254]KKQ70243.1 MAG: putative DNA methylase [Candidatus Falkowbacteria bacterium GW2011_GWE1_38_31]KKQ72581.1 MAG: putative DNA meth